MFDPHCRYVPGATPAEPGMQFDDVTDVRAAFPDVFRCYLEKLFPATPTGGTLFRLPLRTRAMADASEISKSVVTPSKVQGMLEQLKKEAFEILLFTNHLRQISVSEACV